MNNINCVSGYTSNYYYNYFDMPTSGTISSYTCTGLLFAPPTYQQFSTFLIAKCYQCGKFFKVQRYDYMSRCAHCGTEGAI